MYFISQFNVVVYDTLERNSNGYPHLSGENEPNGSKRIQFNITGNRQCNMADAKQVIISKSYINVENISLLLNKVATKFQRLSNVLEIIEVQDTKRKLPI